MITIYLKTSRGTWTLDVPAVSEKPIAGVIAIIDFDGGERQLQIYANSIGDKVYPMTRYVESDVQPLDDDEMWIAEYVPRYSAEDIERR